jgi:hypothetical protein
VKALAFAIVLLIAGCKTLPGCTGGVSPIIQDPKQPAPPIQWLDGLEFSFQCDHK